MDDVIRRTGLPAYVIAPPSDSRDLDSSALLLKVYPAQEEPSYTTPDQWEQLIGRLSDEHCQGDAGKPSTTLALHDPLTIYRANVRLSDDLNQDSVTSLEEPIMIQAHKKQPKTQVDDLQPKDSIAGYHATWQERGLIALAELLPIDEHPERGFILECSYNTATGREPTDRQIDIGTTLTGRVRSYMLDAMRRVGWEIVGKQEGTRKDIWQHISRIATSSAPTLQVEQDQTQKHDSVTRQKKIVEVKKISSRARAPYTREISAKRVTFTCSRCGDQATLEKYPSPIVYCAACAALVRKEKTRARVARLRASRREKK